jgi:hypothetical protein
MVELSWVVSTIQLNSTHLTHCLSTCPSPWFCALQECSRTVMYWALGNRLLYVRWFRLSCREEGIVVAYNSAFIYSLDSYSDITNEIFIVNMIIENLLFYGKLFHRSFDWITLTLFRILKLCQWPVCQKIIKVN